MYKVILERNEDKRIRNGHLWVFSNEIANVTGNPSNGELVEVCDSKGKLLGVGFYNKNSLIAVRMISNSPNDNLSELFSKRIENAFKLRKLLYPHRDSFRMVFSESDYLPGLIIDKYNNTYVLQVNSYGIQKNIDLISEILENQFNAKNIFSKNDFYLRKLEGLPEEDKIYLGKTDIEIIDDGSIKYKIDFSQAQKTGFYFDQSDNRLFIENIVKDKTVADVFCNSGGFGLHALKAGAKSVDFVDSSSREIENVKQNIDLNSLNGDKSYHVKDGFEFLEESIVRQDKFDIVMVDPPAFAKSKKSLPTAEKGYEKLNKLALSVINESGFLISSSCSYHMKKDNFLNCMNRAAVKASKRLQLIYFNEASLDHPKLLAMEETEYLKFAVFNVFSLEKS